MKKLVLTAGILGLLAGSVQAADPLAHTYSIVARDPETGALGVAVQSHWFQVGPIVPWARPGVGAVATQSFVKVDYGPKGLDLLESGKSAQQALDLLLAQDPQKDVRQVAIVDARGGIAVWTGPKCIAEAGHQTGDGFSVQANLMLNSTVWPAMAKAFEAAEGDLAERLLAALEAAEGEGGDIRGRQSAALLVVDPEPVEEPWAGRLVDLRVDDHADPLGEIRRLLHLHRAYEQMNLGDEAMAVGEVDTAVAHYSAATRMAPGIPEIPFWQAVTLFASGNETEALPIFHRVFAAEDRWRKVVTRLPAAGLLPQEGVDRILAAAPSEPDTAVLRVEGMMSEESAECPVLEGRDGRIYSLTGNIDLFDPRQKVWVEGTVAQMSICMKGTTLVVERSGTMD